ncbi:unnamed protein product, partial [marine sediment metagenome]
YRVTLVQDPIRSTTKDEAITTPDASAVQPEPIRDAETVTTQATIEKIPAPETEKAETEHEPESANQRDGELRSADPQPQAQKDREPEKQRAIETGNPGTLVRGPRAEAEYVLQQEELNDYQRVLHDLRRLVQKSLRYPEAARRKGIEGAVAIQFTLSTEGCAKDMVVSVSSGSRILDRAALRSITDIFPYPDPPEAPLHFTIPVTYRLTKQK